MEYTVNKEENCKISLSIIIPSEDYQKEYDEAFRDIKKKVQIPGFRKGKAPAELIKQKYAENIKDAFLDKIIPNKLYEAVDKEKLDIVSRPQISDVEFKYGESMQFKATFEVRPEIKVENYKNLEIKKNVFEVKEEDIDEYIKGVRERLATFVDVKIRNSKEGDKLNLKLDIYDENNNLLNDLSGDNQVLMLEKSNTFFDEVIDNLIDVPVGTVKTISVKFPDNHPAENYRGKKVSIKAEVKEIQEKQVPELNEDLIKKIGKFNTVEEYRKSIKDMMMGQSEYESQKSVEESLRNVLLEKFGNFEIPESTITERRDYLKNRITQDLDRKKLKLEDYLKEMKQTEEDLDKDLAITAEKLVKLDFIYYNIASSEDIKVTDEDIEEELNKISKLYNMDIDKIKKRYSNTGMIDSLRFDLLQNKVVKFLIDSADIKTEIVDRDNKKD